MRLSLLFFVSHLFFGCAKLGYLIEQGGGQLSLLSDAEVNEKILKNPSVPEKYKIKIRQIQKYKKFFYEFLEKKTTEIYSRTTILDRDAVTYLVISSPYYEVKAKEECFPFMGCFPYIGFFKKDSAKEYAEELREESYQTYIRPVYAYSTLGYFTDSILSSFFQYDETELANLIFHELFHTIYFVKNQVELNESLANYFAKRLVEIYFKFDEEKKAEAVQKQKKRNQLNTEIVKHISTLNQRYQALQQKSGKEDQSAYEKELESFIAQDFRPALSQTCQNLNISEDKCFPLKRDWNNASLAAFLTYEKKADKIEELHRKKGGTLKEFLSFLELKQKEYKKVRRKREISFSQFLFEEVK